MHISEYMSVLLLAIVVPLVLSFWSALKLYSHKRALFISIFLIILIIFGNWDVFVVYRDHWSFNPQFVWKIRIINLLLEEVLFFIVIPFCSIFTWEAVKYIKDRIK